MKIAFYMIALVGAGWGPTLIHELIEKGDAHTPPYWITQGLLTVCQLVIARRLAKDSDT